MDKIEWVKDFLDERLPGRRRPDEYVVIHIRDSRGETKQVWVSLRHLAENDKDTLRARLAASDLEQAVERANPGGRIYLNSQFKWSAPGATDL